MNKKLLPILYAFLAAMFYAINTPLSKVLLAHVPATYMAGFLYLGAGVGVGVMYAFTFRHEEKAKRLTRADLPYTLGMILLDILAPIFLMFGIQNGSAASASLLSNFEIVATTLIALFLFHEPVSKRLWVAIALVVLSSAILSLDGTEGLRISPASLWVLLATVCWGMENNCTRRISDKSTYQIVVLKGVFSGAGSIIIAALTGEELPALTYVLQAMLLGFVAYGLSIFLYIRAQSSLGAAKTSAYYAVAPFVGVFLCFVLLGDKLSASFFTALVIMILATVLVVADTLGWKGHRALDKS